MPGTRRHKIWLGGFGTVMNQKDKFRVPKALVEYLCTGQKPKLERSEGREWAKEKSRRELKSRKRKKTFEPGYRKKKKVGTENSRRYHDRSAGKGGDSDLTLDRQKKFRLYARHLKKYTENDV
jgi:hypothetical protein